MYLRKLCELAYVVISLMYRPRNPWCLVYILDGLWVCMPPKQCTLYMHAVNTAVAVLAAEIGIDLGYMIFNALFREFVGECA